jgi:hypothetical protein
MSRGGHRSEEFIQRRRKHAASAQFKCVSKMNILPQISLFISRGNGTNPARNAAALSQNVESTTQAAKAIFQSIEDWVICSEV